MHPVPAEIPVLGGDPWGAELVTGVVLGTRITLERRSRQSPSVVALHFVGWVKMGNGALSGGHRSRHWVRGAASPGAQPWLH